MNFFEAAILVLTLAIPQNTPLKFEVASIRPSPADSRQSGGCHGVDVSDSTIPLGRCVIRHATLRSLIQRAYPFDLPSVSVLQERAVGGPSWIDGSFFDIEAQAENPSTATTAQLREMLRTLLKDRFQLAFHTETREISGYHMLAAKDGFKLKEASGPLTAADYATAQRRTGGAPLMANSTTLKDFSTLISMFAKAPVLDQTGIAGKYNIFLYSAETGDETAGSIFSALPEQLGLRLESQRISFEVYVIDRAEKPAEVDR